MHGLDPCGLEGRKFFCCRALATRDDRTGMPHPFPGRSRHPRDVCHDGFADILLDEGSGRLFVASTDLPHHDDAFGGRVLLEELENIDEVHAAHRIAADANASRLTETVPSRLVHSLVGERPGA